MSLCLIQPENSSAAKNPIDTGLFINFTDSKFLNSEIFHTEQLIIETLDIEKHETNFNKEE